MPYSRIVRDSLSSLCRKEQLGLGGIVDFGKTYSQISGGRRQANRFSKSPILIAARMSVVITAVTGSLLIFWCLCRVSIVKRHSGYSTPDEEIISDNRVIPQLDLCSHSIECLFSETYPWPLAMLGLSAQQTLNGLSSVALGKQASCYSCLSDYGHLGSLLPLFIPCGYIFHPLLIFQH